MLRYTYIACLVLNTRCDSHEVPISANEFLAIISVCIHKFWLNLVRIILTGHSWTILSFAKIGTVKDVPYFLVKWNFSLISYIFFLRSEWNVPSERHALLESINDFFFTRISHLYYDIQCKISAHNAVESSPNTKYLFVQVSFTESCVWLTPTWSQFRVFTFRSTNNIFIHHVTQTTTCISSIRQKLPPSSYTKYRFKY
jgi:hypothetical protein